MNQRLHHRLLAGQPEEFVILTHYKLGMGVPLHLTMVSHGINVFVKGLCFDF